jgi:prophage tail gpP-like protein
MSIRVNGVNLSGFKSGTAFRSMEALCGSFNFTSSVQDDETFPVKVNDLVEVLVDGQTIATGYIDAGSGSYDATTHEATVRGRDLLQDLVDSSIGATKQFTGGTLESITKTVLSDLGFTGVNIINEAGTIKPFEVTETESAEIGMGAFDFLEVYARKRQVLLTTDGLGNIVFARGTTVAPTTRLVMKRGHDGNNILRASYSKDYSKRYNKYKVAAQQNISLLDSTFEQATVDQKGVVLDTGKEEIRATRYLEINAEDNMVSETAKERATWEANFRRANSIIYNPVVQGHLDVDKPWAPNTLVYVEDEYAGVVGNRMIKSVNYMYDLTEGSITELITTSEDAYTLQAVESQRGKQRKQEISIL